MDHRTLHIELLQVMHRFKRLDFARPGELSRGEVYVLESVARDRAAHPDADGTYVSKVAMMLQMSPPGVSRMLRGLEARGLIERNVDPKDRRNTFIRLTERGEATRNRDMRRMRAVMDRVFDAMGSDKMRTLITLLNEWTDTLEAEIGTQKRTMNETDKGDSEC